MLKITQGKNTDLVRGLQFDGQAQAARNAMRPCDRKLRFPLPVGVKTRVPGTCEQRVVYLPVWWQVRVVAEGYGGAAVRAAAPAAAEAAEARGRRVGRGGVRRHVGRHPADSASAGPEPRDTARSAVQRPASRARAPGSRAQPRSQRSVRSHPGREIWLS